MKSLNYLLEGNGQEIFVGLDEVIYEIFSTNFCFFFYENFFQIKYNKGLR